MDDLVSKIEELKKALTALKPKSAQASMVPAIKPPTVKPLSLPSATTGNPPPKMPGVNPMSTKDPAKVAQQLKNPRPKKVKMEVLKVEKNGQWSLDSE